VRREGGKSPAAYTKSWQFRVKVFLHTFQAQGNPAKICCGHVACPLSERYRISLLAAGVRLPLEGGSRAIRKLGCSASSCRVNGPKGLLLKSKGRTIFFMKPAPKAKVTDGALRAAKQIEHNPSFIESAAQMIDRETGVRELVDILEKVIAEAGDLIESRSPELVAQARTTLRRYADEGPGPAE